MFFLRHRGIINIYAVFKFYVFQPNQSSGYPCFGKKWFWHFLTDWGQSAKGGEIPVFYTHTHTHAHSKNKKSQKALWNVVLSAHQLMAWPDFRRLNDSLIVRCMSSHWIGDTDLVPVRGNPQRGAGKAECNQHL